MKLVLAQQPRTLNNTNRSSQPKPKQSKVKKTKIQKKIRQMIQNLYCIKEQKQLLNYLPVPKRPHARSKYFQALHIYNKSRKYKKRYHKETIINKLDTMRQESPSEFWKLLEKFNEESDGNGVKTR